MSFYNYCLGTLSLLKMRLKASKSFEHSYQWTVHWNDPQAIKQANKICLYAHFSDDGSIDSHCLKYLSELHELGFAIVFCSTSLLSEASIVSVKPVTQAILSRPNVGFDFGSWACAWRFLQEQGLQPKKQDVLLAHDSVYGPIHPLKDTFERMNKKSLDFWGMTTNSFPREHLQSYFLYFNKAMVGGQEFNDYLMDVKLLHNKNRLILDHEIRLTSHFTKKGFSWEAAFLIEARDFEPLMLRAKSFFNPDPTIWLWNQLIEKHKFPFLKKSVVKYNPNNVLSLADVHEWVAGN